MRYDKSDNLKIMGIGARSIHYAPKLVKKLSKRMIVYDFETSFWKKKYFEW